MSHSFDPPLNFPGNTYHGYPRHDFLLGENQIVVVEPKEPVPGRRWVWVAEFFGAFPAFDLEMLRRGWWVAHMNVGNTFGCPTAMKRFDAFYAEMTGKYGFHSKPLLEGLSRGGLYVYNWAARNPESVGMLYADNPVCDFKSWPGGKGGGPGSSEDWKALLKCYGFKSEEEAFAWPFNPIDNIEPLIKSKIPLVHCFGDADETVPWEENTKVLAERAEALGGRIQLFRRAGGKHHPHGPEDVVAFADWVLAHIRE